ncbi:MAG TPA: nitrous oxide reductase accessory protein NosL [Flavisolibacter sp.]|nr:nitrous oxide reductase accessory protein NosL [Flavisolibacter sp.]
MNKMSLPSRIIIALASLSMLATYFLPVWFIFLLAPQYPEGLTMNIWLNKLTGQVEIINGLNHYIGMKHIKVEMFPEFQFLVYIVAVYIILGLIVAIIGKRKWLFGYLVLAVIGAIAAMIDFYKWGYDYGHNLDPKAAIQIPGFSYQPPLIGHKTLLNFDAYSYPDSGGWVVIIAGAVLFFVWLFEWRRSRKTTKAKIPAKKTVAVAVVSLMMISSCTTKPEAIVIGKDLCSDCSMTIMDAKFGGEIITKKGKTFKFDDVHCLANYIKKGAVKKEDVGQTLFINYQQPNTFLDEKTAWFVVSQQLKSPMNSNAAAFTNKVTAEQKAKETNGDLKAWHELYQVL